MSFLGLPTELRLPIYAELLVHSEPVVFVADYGPISPPLFRTAKYGLRPAILRTNSQIYREAISFLYSGNRFSFPDIPTATSFAIDTVHIAPFLDQIGSQTGRIRHICFSFPITYHYRHGRTLHEALIKNLQHIRNACTSLTTLELSLDSLKNSFLLDDSDYGVKGSPTAGEALDLLNSHLNAIPSLKEIIINIKVYGEQELSENLMKKVGGLGWRPRIMNLEMPKEKWISADDRVEFDNEEDCLAYDEEQFRLEMQREQEEEDRQWLEEYHRRRRDPYWKNDSDYD